jgi:hypothetical protein
MFRLNVATRYEALFASDLQSSQHPDARQVRAAIRYALRALGARACLARVAQEFGDHPEAAVVRMRWVREAVSQAYGDAHRGWSQRRRDHLAGRRA